MKCRLDLEDNGAVLPLAEGGGGANLPNLASCLDEGDPPWSTLVSFSALTLQLFLKADILLNVNPNVPVEIKGALVWSKLFSIH